VQVLGEDASGFTARFRTGSYRKKRR